MSWLILGVLAFIAWQVVVVRRALAHEMSETREYRARREEDEYIKSRCPNLFFRWRDELRQWYSLVARDGPEADSWNWGTAFEQLERRTEQSVADSPILSALVAASTDFRDRRAALTVLREDEVEFCLYQAWKRFEDIRELDGDTFKLRVVLFNSFLDEQLKLYRLPQGRGA